MVSLQSFEYFKASFLWSIRLCRQWKIVFDLFFKIIFFYEKPKTTQPALRDMLCHSHGLYSHSLSISSLPADVLWGSFVTHSFLPQRTSAGRLEYQAFKTIALDQSAREDSLSYCKK